MKILVVCSGNICRSPLAEAVLRSRFRAGGVGPFELASAGTLGLEGLRADPMVVSVASAAGYDVAAHRSRALTRELVASSDLVLVMEREHLEEARSLSPKHKAIHLITEFLPPTDSPSFQMEVPDPIGGTESEFRECLSLLERCAVGVEESARKRCRDENETEYFRTISSRVATARGGSPDLSPLEFHIVDRWWQADTPLWLLCEAIVAVASAWRDGEAPRSFLKKCEAEVIRRLGVVGAPSPDGGQSLSDDEDRDRICRAIRDRFESAAALLDASAAPLRAALKRVLPRFDTAPPSLSRLADDLQTAEIEVAEAAARCVPAEQLDRWRLEAWERLERAQMGISSGAREQAILRLQRERLFERFSIRPMSILALLRRAD